MSQCAFELDGMLCIVRHIAEEMHAHTSGNAWTEMAL